MLKYIPVYVPIISHDSPFPETTRWLTWQAARTRDERFRIQSGTMLLLLREKIKKWCVDDTFPNGNITSGSGVCVWSSVCGDKSPGRQMRWRHPSHAHYFPGQEGKVDKSSQWVVLHPTVCVCVLLLSSGKCQTWCWLIPSQRTFLKRTSGRSTGEFVVEGFRGLSRKKKKK